jgi:hypothetical protein
MLPGVSQHPVPSRASVETTGGARLAAYVTDIEDGLLTLLLNRPLPRRYMDDVRLTFRAEGRPSLGMVGKVIHSTRDRATVALDHPVDRVTLDGWRKASAGRGPRVRLEDTVEDLAPLFRR